MQLEPHRLNACMVLYMVTLITNIVTLAVNVAMFHAIILHNLWCIAMLTASTKHHLWRAADIVNVFVKLHATTL